MRTYFWVSVKFKYSFEWLFKSQNKLFLRSGRIIGEQVVNVLEPAKGSESVANGGSGWSKSSQGGSIWAPKTGSWSKVSSGSESIGFKTESQMSIGWIGSIWIIRPKTGSKIHAGPKIYIGTEIAGLSRWGVGSSSSKGSESSVRLLPGAAPGSTTVHQRITSPRSSSIQIRLRGEIGRFVVASGGGSGQFPLETWLIR